MRSRLILAALVAVSVAAALGVAASALESRNVDSRTARQWAPGAAGSVGAMKRLAPDPATPTKAVDAARHFALQSGGSPATAALTLRTLRSDLGERAGKLYGFSPDGTAVCLMHWERALTCPTARETPTPGVLWMVSGGYPAWARADGVPVPSALIGIVTDDVQSVTFIENGVERPVEIRNNAFYLEVGTSDPGVKWHHLRTGYSSGKEATARVPAH